MSELLRPDDWEQPVAIPAIGNTRRVLVPFDGSHTAERALAWGLRLATASEGAEIIVLVAFERPFTKKGRGSLYVDDMRAALHEEANELASEAIAQLTAHGASARAVVIQGDPATAILEVSDEDDVDIIVLGGRGLTSELRGFAGSVERFRSALSGGVADKIVRNSLRPVLVVE